MKRATSVILGTILAASSWQVGADNLPSWTRPTGQGTEFSGHPGGPADATYSTWGFGTVIPTVPWPPTPIFSDTAAWGGHVVPTLNWPVSGGQFTGNAFLHAYLPILDTHTGVVALSGTLKFNIPNTPFDHGPEKWIQVQVDWKPMLPGAGDRPILFAQTTGLRDISSSEWTWVTTALPDGWFHTTYLAAGFDDLFTTPSLHHNPSGEMLVLQGNIYVDNVIIDTVCSSWQVVADDDDAPPWTRPTGQGTEFSGHPGGPADSTYSTWGFGTVIPTAQWASIFSDTAAWGGHVVPTLNWPVSGGQFTGNAFLHAYLPILDTHTGVVALSGTLKFNIPNTPFDHGPEKWIQVQVDWKPILPGAGDRPSLFAQTTGLREIRGSEWTWVTTALPDGWFHTTYSAAGFDDLFTTPSLHHNPSGEMLVLEGNIYVDNVIIDTVCWPEPVPVPGLNLSKENGLIVAGLIGQAVTIEYASGLGATSQWFTRTNLTLTSTVQSVLSPAEAFAPDQSVRFYRARIQ